MNIIKVMKKGCKISAIDIFKESIKVATIVVIGYSIYTDLSVMSWSKNIIGDYGTCCETPYCGYLIASLIITVFTIIVQMLDFMLGNSYDCVAS